MLTKSDAQLLVESELSNLDSNDGLQIVEDSTSEYSWGWVFYYQSKEYLETGDFRDRLAGNAPYIVNKISGEIRCTGTAHNIEYYVGEYEAEIRERG
jgi:hypothetical protein